MVATTERRDVGDRSLYCFLIAFYQHQLIEDASRFENAKQLIVHEKCIVDTSGTVCLLVTSQFLKRIPANSKIFIHTLQISL